MKALNTAVGIVTARLAGRPFYARYHVTHRCNYQCRMCGFHRRGGQTRELEQEEIRAVAATLARLGARHLVLTGGEPFLRKDLPEIVAAFARRGFSIRIQTNGGPQVTRERLAACARAGLQDISVSVDTLDAALQDGICGARGALSSAIRTLDLAAELLPRSMSLANIVASRYNFEELPDLVAFFRDRGVYSYITPVMIGGASEAEGDYRFRSDDGAFRMDTIPASVRNDIIDRLIAMRRSGAGLTNSTRFLRDFRRYLECGQCRWRCDSENLCLEVLPDGSVSMCKEKPPTASILASDFEARYRRGEFQRDAARHADSCAGCFYGEYREPYYAVHDLSVLGEWTRDWLRTFRRGMRRAGTKAGANSGARPGVRHTRARQPV